MPLTDEALIERCREAAIALLHANSTPHGVLAATRTPAAEARRYTRVFGRDAAICTLGMVVSGDPDLHATAQAGLLTLARHQAPNGQIPKYVDAERDEADFWYLGCIDATLWWLIAVRFLLARSPDTDLAASLAAAIARALTWLECQEHQRLHLLQQNEASDWADIMPRSGFVLYTNALWYHVKRQYDRPRQRETHYHGNYLFHPFGSHVPDYRRLRVLSHFVRRNAKNQALYLSFVNFSFFGEEGDVFGNLLAILFGLARGDRAAHILRAIAAARADAPFPIRVTLEPIGQDHLLWREYMGRHRQNVDWQYHNGGIWPFVGGFYVLALVTRGRGIDARAALVQLARANALNEWQFNEWLHGRDGTPAGMPGQSWNAAMFLLAHHVVCEHPIRRVF
ncbi:MAG: glycoside hydrolase [Gammaproteobacteria bacterium]|nr:glycoside hydrolase [Gammaproteobacteria bacterium]